MCLKFVILQSKIRPPISAYVRRCTIHARVLPDKRCQPLVVVCRRVVMETTGATTVAVATLLAYRRHGAVVHGDRLIAVRRCC